MRSHPHLAEAFALEMEKIALGNIGASAATLGTVGSLLGGGAGYMKAKAEGQDTKDALLTAGKGALIGGGAGALGGAGLAGASKRVGKRIGDFGRRQVHAVSGYVPKGQNSTQYLESIGIGNTTGPAWEAAQKHLQEVEAGRGKGLIPMPQPLRKGLAMWDELSARKAHEANKVFMEHDATSLPGVVRALWDKKSRVPVLGALGKDTAFGGGMMGTAMLGLGAHDVYKGVTGQVQPGQEDMGRGERMGEAFGNAAGWLLPSPVPIAGQMIGGTVMSKTLGGVGALADKVLGNKTPRQLSNPSVARAPVTDPTDPVASTAQQLGGPQVVLSSSAAGKPYGGGIE